VSLAERRVLGLSLALWSNSDCYRGNLDRFPVLRVHSIDPRHAKLISFECLRATRHGKTVLITGRSPGIERMSAKLFGGEMMAVEETLQPTRRILKNDPIFSVFYSAERILAILSALGDAL